MLCIQIGKGVNGRMQEKKDAEDLRIYRDNDALCCWIQYVIKKNLTMRIVLSHCIAGNG